MELCGNKEVPIYLRCTYVKKSTDRYLKEETGRSVFTEAGGLDSFTNAGQVSGWAADSLAALTASGILQGTSSTTLSPKDTTTVEQAILLTLRAYQEFSK